MILLLELKNNNLLISLSKIATVHFSALTENKKKTPSKNCLYVWVFQFLSIPKTIFVEFTSNSHGVKCNGWLEFCKLHFNALTQKSTMTIKHLPELLIYSWLIKFAEKWRVADAVFGEHYYLWPDVLS